MSQTGRHFAAGRQEPDPPGAVKDPGPDAVGQRFEPDPALATMLLRSRMSTLAWYLTSTAGIAATATVLIAAVAVVLLALAGVI